MHLYVNKPDTQYPPVYVCTTTLRYYTRRTGAYVLKRTSHKLRRHSGIRPRRVNSEPLDLVHLHIFFSLHTACARSASPHLYPCSRWRRNIGWGCSKIGCWGRCLGLRERGDGGGAVWKRQLNEELYDLPPPNNIRVMTSRRMRWSHHVAHTKNRICAYRVLVGKPQGRRPVLRPKIRW